MAGGRRLFGTRRPSLLTLSLIAAGIVVAVAVALFLATGLHLHLNDR